MSASRQIECPLCQGSGWKTVSAGEDGPSRVARCDCRVEGWGERLLERARIPSRYKHCTLADFDIGFPGAHPKLADARLLAGRFVEEYPAEDSGLLFIGPIGVGKTHLAVGVIRELMLQKNADCLFYDYRELLKEIQNSYNASVNTTELEVLKPIFEAEVLVLDELGAVRPTEWVWDTVSHILNTRYNDRRTTIITTNFADLPASASSGTPTSRAAREETLGDRIGDRMRSRLQEMCRKIEMQGSDFRQRVRSANF